MRVLCPRVHVNRLHQLCPERDARRWDVHLPHPWLHRLQLLRLHVPGDSDATWRLHWSSPHLRMHLTRGLELQRSRDDRRWLLQVRRVGLHRLCVRALLGHRNAGRRLMHGERHPWLP